MGKKIVPDIVREQLLTVLPPDTPVGEAARRMAERNIGAVMIGGFDNLIGIVSERDIVKRVVATGRNPEVTLVRDIMTANPTTIEPGMSPEAALELMRETNCRHLPVVKDGRIVGMLSIRDLYAAVHDELSDGLKFRDQLIMGYDYSLQA